MARGAGQVVAGQAPAQVAHLGADVGEGARGQLVAVLHKILVVAGGQLVDLGHGAAGELDGGGRVGRQGSACGQRGGGGEPAEGGGHRGMCHGPIV